MTSKPQSKPVTKPIPSDNPKNDLRVIFGPDGKILRDGRKPK